MDILKIFVSHSHENNAFTLPLVDALRDAGADVWFDEHNLGSGHLLDTIERELRTRPIFILILSPDALQSQWVRNEANWAFNRTQRDPQRIFLPILAAVVDPETIWLFIESYRRIESPGGQPYPLEEAIHRTLNIFSLLPPSQKLADTISNPDDLILQGYALFYQARFQQACDVLHRALSLAPRNPNLFAYYLLGISYRRLRRYDAAMGVFHQALVLDPTSAIEWAGKAAVLWQMGHHTEALAAADTALTLDQRQPLVWNIRGIALLAFKQYDEALAAFERSIFFDPTVNRYWSNIALTQVWAKQYHLAAMSADIAIELDSQYPDAFIHRGWALLGLHHYEGAVTACQQALQLSEENYEAWLCGGYALRCLHQEEEASAWEARAQVLIEEDMEQPVPFTMEGDMLVALR